MDRKVFWALVAYTAGLFALYVLYLFLAPFWTALIWAAVVGIATFPVYERLKTRIGGREGRAAALMVLVVFLVVVLPTIGFVALLAGQGAQVYGSLQAASEGGKLDALDALRAHPTLAPWIARAESLLQTFGVDARGDLLPAVKRVISGVLGVATGLLKDALISLLNLILMLVILFFLYRDGPRLADEFWALMPLAAEDKAKLKETLARVLRAAVVGILGTCLIQGFLGGIGFWISGLPSPALFGALMAIAALIPFVGTALIWLPGGIYLLVAGRMAKGIFLLLWGVFAVSGIDNIIRPLLIGGRAQLPISLMALGALGGFATFGLVGVIVGPVIVSLLLALFEMYKAVSNGAGGAGPPAAGPGGEGGRPA